MIYLFLRDDDAIAPTPALKRLDSLALHFSIPLALAVIPHFVKEPFFLDSTYTVWQHGVTHQNHGTEKKIELGGTFEVSQLEAGYHKLATIFQEQFQPIIVPPWNRIEPYVLKACENLPFQGISAIGTLNTKLKQRPIHLDVVDWQAPGKPVYPLKILIDKFEQCLQQPGVTFIGILTHHLIHQEQDWQHLEAFFHYIAQSRQAYTWLTGWQLFDLTL